MNAKYFIHDTTDMMRGDVKVNGLDMTELIVGYPNKVRERGIGIPIGSSLWLPLL